MSKKLAVMLGLSLLGLMLGSGRHAMALGNRLPTITVAITNATGKTIYGELYFDNNLIVQVPPPFQTQYYYMSYLTPSTKNLGAFFTTVPPGQPGWTKNQNRCGYAGDPTDQRVNWNIGVFFDPARPNCNGTTPCCTIYLSSNGK